MTPCVVWNRGDNITNEELVIRIKAGERHLIEKLWEQTQAFIAQQASRRLYMLNGAGGLELSDLVQCGYFALLNAVNAFEPERGYKFLTYLNYSLKTEFAEALGYRSRRPNGPIRFAISLDAPLDENDLDSGTLLDLQQETTDYIGDKEHQIWLAQLQRAISRAMKILPEQNRKVLTCRYWKNLSKKGAAQITGLSLTQVRNLEYTGLLLLRRDPRTRRELIQFVEREVDKYTPFYRKTSLREFCTTHTSVVEQLTIDREDMRRAAFEKQIYDKSTEKFSAERDEKTRRKDQNNGQNA